MSGSKLRLFFALWPDPRTREAIAALADRVAAETAGRATAPDNVHLTLAFLGAQPRETLPALTAAATAAVVDAAPFVLALDHVDCWRNNGVAWLGARDLPPALASLHRSLASALATIGIATEARPFAVHVTLARKIARLLRYRLSATIDWPVDAFVLAASETGDAGPAYRVLAELPLGARR